MHSNSILTSNLLDIIFENRNKDYGAYVLRKDYNKRLFKSLVTDFTLTMIIVWCLMIAEKKIKPNLNSTPFVPDVSITAIESIKKIIEPAKKHIASQQKPISGSDKKAVIVKNIDPEKITPATLQIVAPNTGEDIELPFETSVSNEPNNGDVDSRPSKLPVTVDKNLPVISPDVLPQYPGGIKELIKFLKRNLTAPQVTQDGEEIVVKVKFIVNYDGDLTGFDVMETGGEPFDNEVIRVLKKMPKWIPGKAGGESVSTYFIIPVKFRQSE